MCVCGSDLQGHLENVEEHISRQKQALREASAKHQVSILLHIHLLYMYIQCIYMYSMVLCKIRESMIAKRLKECPTAYVHVHVVHVQCIYMYVHVVHVQCIYMYVHVVHLYVIG